MSPEMKELMRRLTWRSSQTLLSKVLGYDQPAPQEPKQHKQQQPQD